MEHCSHTRPRTTQENRAASRGTLLYLTPYLLASCLRHVQTGRVVRRFSTPPADAGAAAHCTSRAGLQRPGAGGADSPRQHGDPRLIPDAITLDAGGGPADAGRTGRTGGAGGGLPLESSATHVPGARRMEGWGHPPTRPGVQAIRACCTSVRPLLKTKAAGWYVCKKLPCNQWPDGHADAGKTMQCIEYKRYQRHVPWNTAKVYAKNKMHPMIDDDNHEAALVEPEVPDCDHWQWCNREENSDKVKKEMKR